MKQEKVWDEIAEQWNQFRRVRFQNTTTFLEECKGKILDLGCGSGRNFMKKENLNFYGIDFSEKMLNHAKKRAEKLNLNIHLQKAPTYKLPFDNEYFDNALLVTVLHCVETAQQRKKTLEEAHRVLKQGGKMLISVWGPHSPRIKGKKTGHIQVPWTVNGKKLIREQYVYTEKELRTLLKNVGFNIVSFDEEHNLNFIVQKP